MTINESLGFWRQRHEWNTWTTVHLSDASRRILSHSSSCLRTELLIKNYAAAVIAMARRELLDPGAVRSTFRGLTTVVASFPSGGTNADDTGGRKRR